MVKPAPKVEAATASPATPRKPPVVDAALSRSEVDGAVAKAPRVEMAVADPPTERGAIDDECDDDQNEKGIASNTSNEGPSSSVERLRATNRIIFESPAAVVIGPAEKNLLQKLFPPLFNERSFLSYGEIKRYILILDSNTASGTMKSSNKHDLCCLVYADVTDPSPLYTLPLSNLMLVRENPKHPDFYSHTISPKANSTNNQSVTGLPFDVPIGLPFDNRSKSCLETVLLKEITGGSVFGKSGRGGKIKFQITFDVEECGNDIVDQFQSAINPSKCGTGERKFT